jgi:two-component system chemotaxis response regulator CheY
MSMTFEDLSLLLVEPSHAQQIILREHLEKVGVRRIGVVDTMQTALEQVRAFTPDAVLSAMHLPDGKGSELLTAIRSDESTADVAFLLVSSETRTHELEPVRQGGAVAIIPKPCTEADLVKALGDTLDLLTKDSLALAHEDIADVRALVVDDSKTARRFIVKVLGQLGIETVTQAADGLEAVERLAESFFDLVVTDYNMPNMDGHQLVEFIRQESSQPTVPVLMITSERSGARVAGVERAGVSAIVDKPFEIDRVRHILANVLG